MYDILKKNELFRDIELKEIESLLKCLDGRAREYLKGEYIFLAGLSAPSVGILLSGKAHIIRENVWGDSMIIGNLYPGDMFGETFACIGTKVMPVSVFTLEKSTVVMLNVGKIIHTCSNSCGFHNQLITNLLRIVAQKSLKLNQKMSYLTNKTIRGKLEAYFNDCMEQSGTNVFTLPMNRREMADFLCIDRSAMSRELSNMKKEGVLDYDGRNIKWL